MIVSVLFIDTFLSSKFYKMIVKHVQWFNNGSMLIVCSIKMVKLLWLGKNNNN